MKMDEKQIEKLFLIYVIIDFSNNSMVRVLSFDVGIRNLAYCVLNFESTNNIEITKWGMINLCKDDDENKCRYCNSKGAFAIPQEIINNISLQNELDRYIFPMKKSKKTGPTMNEKIKRNGKLICGKHLKKGNLFTRSESRIFTLNFLNSLNALSLSDIVSEHAIPTTILSSVDDPTHQFTEKQQKRHQIREIFMHVQQRTCHPVSKNANILNLVEASRNLYTTVLELNLFENIDVVLIENQIGPLAVRMKSIQGMLIQCAVSFHISDIKCISSSHKLTIPFSSKNLITDNDEKETVTDSYKNRKQSGVTHCLQWLNSVPSLQSWTTFFQKKTKKDDLADAFLQALWFVQS